MSDQPKKTALVDKPISVSYDFGNLTVFDTNPLDKQQLQENKEEHLTSVARDNIQLLVNQLLSLPVKRTADSVQSGGTQDSTMTLFQLPDPTTPLPREKPIPKPKAPTKWEKFATKKGIQKKSKEGKLVYDEQSGEWVPKWGYKGINKAKDDQWLVELDDKKHPKDQELIDPRTLGRQDRKKLVKKNERQQKKNAMRAAGGS